MTVLTNEFTLLITHAVALLTGVCIGLRGR